LDYRKRFPVNPGERLASTRSIPRFGSSRRRKSSPTRWPISTSPTV